MDRPRRSTPKKNDVTEMIGLLPEEEAALRRALLASMQSEKAINKKPSPSKKGCKRGARRGKGRCKRPRGQREHNERLDNSEARCESRFTENSPQFSSSSPFTEPDGMTMGQDAPEQSSDSDSDFSAEEIVSWTPGKKELSSYNQMQLQDSASTESDLSSYNGRETPDFHLTLSQSDSATPNDVSSPMTNDNSRHCYQSLESKLTSSRCLYHAQKNILHQLPCQLGRQNQSDILKTEDFLSFLCMRNENEQLPGLLQQFRVTKVRGVTRGLSQCRKRKLTDQKKKHGVTKKLVFYKQTDM